MNNKIENLENREKQLEARIASIRARNNISERKKDTRRKILIGAYVMDLYNKKGKKNELYKSMRDYLKREQDKKLFELHEK